MSKNVINFNIVKYYKELSILHEKYVPTSTNNLSIGPVFIEVALGVFKTHFDLVGFFSADYTLHAACLVFRHLPAIRRDSVIEEVSMKLCYQGTAS